MLFDEELPIIGVGLKSSAIYSCHTSIAAAVHIPVF